MCLWAELEREVICKFPKGLWGFTGAQQVLRGKRTTWKLAVELLLLVFVAFKALAERKETRNGGAGLVC